MQMICRLVSKVCLRGHTGTSFLNHSLFMSGLSGCNMFMTGSRYDGCSAFWSMLLQCVDNLCAPAALPIDPVLLIDTKRTGS